MLCDICKKNPASVQLQHFVFGKKGKTQVCADCAEKMKGAKMPPGVENIIKKILEQFKDQNQAQAACPLGLAAVVSVSSEKTSCKNCGLTSDELRKNGKLGCMDCYDCFKGDVLAILASVQSGTRHTGKFPRRTGSLVLRERQAAELRERLREVVAEENFEMAARLRDEIKALGV